MFQPLVAKVVDANGVPVINTAVTWTATGNGGPANAETVTDGNGLTSNTFVANTITGQGQVNFIPSQISAFVVATPSAAPANFNEVQAFAQGTSQAVDVEAFPIAVPQSISGPAGIPAPQIQFAVGASNIPIPGVELRLVNSQSSPSVSCVTGPSVTLSNGLTITPDPGTVLTDVTGYATCTPIPAGSGTGQFLALVGGVADNPGAPPLCSENYADGGGAASGFGGSNCIPLAVTAPSPGAIQIVQGNNQSATAGQAISSPLIAILTDTNGNPLTGQGVNWSVSPSNAGTLTNQSAASSSNGTVQTGFTTASTASGNITITVSVASNSNIKTSFSLTAIPLIFVTSLQIVSNGGNNQTAMSGQTFANPLVVQVTNSNGQLATGATVNFSASGPVFLSTTAPATNSAGQAQVTVTAGTTTAQTQAIITASIAGLSQTFTLTVLPAGPTVTARGFANGADQQVGSISPCSLATLTGAGIAPNIQGTVVGAPFGPGPLTLGNVSITFSGANSASPIFSISNINGVQSATFQVPCEITASAAELVTVSVGGGSAQVSVPVLAVSPGVFGTPGTDGVVRATLVRQDGSFVTLLNPARRGETVTAFVTGLGPTTPPVSTNQVPPVGVTSTVNATVVPGMSGAAATLVSARLATDLVGVYEVSFVVPATVAPGNNVGFSVGAIAVGTITTQYSNLIFVPVQ
jgi:uncharacterized protein (TIGR03437 family)